MIRFKSIFDEVRPTLALAVPIIVGQVSQMLMGITDSVMIGQTGTVPLAASSFGGNVFGVFYIVGIGLMLPVAVFVARARGAGRPQECGEYLRHGLALALAFGVIETALMVALATQMHWFQQPPEVLAAVNPFFLLIGLSITPVLIYLAFRQFAEAMGRPWAPMFIMLAGVGLNVFLNWVFIWGKLGAPAMGLAGAGVSTLISRAIGAWVIFEWLRRDPAMRVAWPKRWWAPLSGARIKEMLTLGLPTSGILLFESGAFRAVQETVLVTAPDALRIERVVIRDGVTEAEVRQRMTHQWPEERKAAMADHIVVNDGRSLLIPQVLKLHQKFSS